MLFRSGNVLINGFDSSTVGLTVKGAGSQSANLQEWQNSNGSTIASISSQGNFADNANAANYLGMFIIGIQGLSPRSTTASKLYYSANDLIIESVNSAYKGLIVKSAASQTANLQEWQNSAGTVLARIASDGAFYAGGLSVYANGNASLGNTLSTSYLQTVYWLNIATYSGGPVSQVPLTVNGVSGQTGNLTEWKNSSGTVLSKITSAGYMDSAIGLFDSIRASGGSVARMIVSAGNTNNISIPAVNSTYVPLILKGASSQSANLQEWQN